MQQKKTTEEDKTEIIPKHEFLNINVKKLFCPLSLTNFPNETRRQTFYFHENSHSIALNFNSFYERVDVTPKIKRSIKIICRNRLKSIAKTQN